MPQKITECCGTHGNMLGQHFTELRECCVRVFADELADFFFVGFEFRLLENTYRKTQLERIRNWSGVIL